METFLTYRPKPGCWAWWPRLGGRVQRSSPGPPKPACRGGQPPHTCPGRRTGSPGCAGFSDELGSRSLPAGLQPRRRCCVGAALWGSHAQGKVQLGCQKGKTWGDYISNYICAHTMLWLQGIIWLWGWLNYHLMAWHYLPQCPVT